MNLLSVISFATFKNSTSAIAAIKDLTDSVFLNDMWYVHLSTGGSVDAKFIGVASTEKASAVGIVDGLQHFQKCV
jgi:hypothetical protein